MTNGRDSSTVKARTDDRPRDLFPFGRGMTSTAGHVPNVSSSVSRQMEGVPSSMLFPAGSRR